MEEAAAATPRAYPDGAPWTAWQGICLVDGSDRLTAGNGVCELQESLTFRSDCEPTCGDSTFTADEAMTCIQDWLADRRGCEAGTNICVGPADCGNGKCEYDDQHQEDACTCPEDCSTPDQYRAIRNQDGGCTAPTNDPNPAAVCPCGDGSCEPHETFHSCPEDCDDSGTTSSTTDDSETGSTTDTIDTTDATDTSPPPCDDDPVCGPNETVKTCPGQCNVCGDGVVYGDEACDNGINDDDIYSQAKPPGDPCAPGCVDVAFCGDGATHAPDEACDEEGAQTPTCEANCQEPTCGDGTVNSLIGEVCDDSGIIDGDGCAADCKFFERNVFITSATFKGDMSSAMMPSLDAALMGVARGDNRCQSLAEMAGLPGTYKVWLSDSIAQPVSRFDTTFKGHYRLRSGDFPIVATGWEGLADGTLDHPIDADELGSLTSGEVVWTNTSTGGTQVSKENHCDSWTTAVLNSSTIVGDSSESSESWTDGVSNPCKNGSRLYCFQDL